MILNCAIYALFTTGITKTLEMILPMLMDCVTKTFVRATEENDYRANVYIYIYIRFVSYL